MDRTAIVERIMDEAAHLTRYRRASMTESTSLVDLELDSLDSVYFTADIEDEFDVEISCVERIETMTIGQMADLVAEKLGIVTQEIRLAA